ncbi:MAG: phage tail tube protein [Candidatus Bathyarchaeota archaeon]|nr:phage tail tube protein [Candidatus Bathyarchaeota archaeon]
MTTPVYGAHEAKVYYVVESTYGETPTNPSMTGLATAENAEPNLNPSLIKIRGTGSRDLQAIRKGLRQVGLKIGYNLPSAAPIDFLLHIQTMSSLSVEVVYEKATGIIDLLYMGCRFNSVTVECSVEDLMKATVELIGQDVAVGTAKISGATYADHSGAVPYYESYVKKDTTTLDRVADFRFTIENNLKRVPVIRTSDGHLLKYLPERHRNCSGELMFDFETKDEFEDVINDAEFSLEFGLGGSNKAVFSNCKWDSVSAPTRLEDLVSVKAPFVAQSVAIS